MKLRVKITLSNLVTFSKWEWRTCKDRRFRGAGQGNTCFGAFDLSAVLENSAGLYAERAAEAALSFGRCGLASHSDGRVAVKSRGRVAQLGPRLATGGITQ